MDKIQRTFFVVSLSAATVTGASSHTKPAAARNLECSFPLQINLNLYERRVPNIELQLLSRPWRLLTVFLHTRKYRSIHAMGVDWSQKFYLSVSPTYNVTDSFLEIYDATVYDLSNV
jgi:hypothetical protein